MHGGNPPKLPAAPAAPTSADMKILRKLRADTSKDSNPSVLGTGIEPGESRNRLAGRSLPVNSTPQNLAAKSEHGSACRKTSLESPALVERVQKPKELLTQFRMAGNDGLEDAWNAFLLLDELGIVRRLDIQELVRFANKFVKIIDKENRERKDGQDIPDILQTSLERLIRVMRALETHFPSWTDDRQNQSLRLYFTALILSSTGRPADARPMVQQYIDTRKEAQDPSIPSVRIFRSLEHLIMAYERQSPGSWDGVNMVLDNWDICSGHVLHLGLLKGTTNCKLSGSDLRSRLFTILEQLDCVRWFAAQARNPDCDRIRISHTGSMLITSLCSQWSSRPLQALAVYAELKARGIPLIPQIGFRLTRELTWAREIDAANRVMASLSPTKPGATPTPAEISTRLFLAAGQSRTAEAEKLFKSLSSSQVMPHDTKHFLYSQGLKKSPAEVEHLFYQLFPPSPSKSNVYWTHKPTAYHFGSVIMAYAKAGDWAGVKEWFLKMTKAGVQPNTWTFNTLLSSLGAQVDMDVANAICKELVENDNQPDAVTYTLIISVYGFRKDPIAAESIYQQAIGQGIKPDNWLLTALMTAHVNSGSWAGVIRVFDYIQSSTNRRIKLSVVTFNVLLKAYVLIGSPFQTVSRLFRTLTDEGMRPNERTYALVIQSACDAGRMDIASDLFVELDEKVKLTPSHELAVNVYIFTIIMAGYLRKGDHARAKAVYEEMGTREIQPSPVTFSAIVRAYVNEGSEESIQLAKDFLSTITRASHSKRHWMHHQITRDRALEIMFGPLMNAYSHLTNPKEVMNQINLMLEAGGKPSAVTLTILLDAYRRLGAVGEVKEIWKQIHKIINLDNNKAKVSFGELSGGSKKNGSTSQNRNAFCLPFSIYVDALSAAGEHEEIAKTWTKLRDTGFSFDSHNWNHLAVALVRAGQPDRAFEILERIILPFNEKSQSLTESRDMNPNSPLIFNRDNTDGELDTTEPTIRNARMRAANMELNELYAGDILDRAAVDYVQPLHVLHQISPSWNFWRPHNVTIRVLYTALSNLERGLVPQVVGRGYQLEPGESPASTLQKIYNDFPNALKVVREQQERAFSRLEVNEEDGNMGRY